MSIFIVIGIEAVIMAGCVVGWMRYDSRIRAWEDRMIAGIKSKVRRSKRDLCAKWLAEDGMTAIPRLADNEDIIFLRK